MKMLTVLNCSNINMHTDVADIDLTAYAVRLSFNIHSQYISVYSSWLSKFGRDRNWGLRKGYIFSLDLAFDSKLLRTICENEEEAVRELGSSAAEVLKHRLADLRAARSVNDLLVGRPRVIEGGVHDQQMIVDLRDDYQMIFCANHPDNPVVENGKIDWPKVSRIKILRIERNYD